MPAGALEGLCPACLLAQGAESTQGRGFTPPATEEIARLFPQLEILGLLGAGGMGAVYKARQPALDRLVALKILPAKSADGVNFAERFNREARALARLSHPNIVAVHEFGQAGGLHFFIMEFVDGANLRQLEQSCRLSPREALQIIPQICDALQYAHDEGVVHRDIKPENVLVDRKGRVKIADFGLAKILGQDPAMLRLTAEGQVMGTPHYMAPEQVERPLAVDHRADIYSLGVVFYEMLTGDLPLGKFPPPSRKVQVDVRFDEVVLRSLENDPARRYQQASEVKSQVESISGTPLPADAAAAPIPSQKFVRWAGFPVVVEQAGARRVNRKGALQAFGIIFGVLTIVFGVISLPSGRSLFGWLGISGYLSLTVRLLIAALAVATGVLWALRKSSSPAEAATLQQTPKGTVILPPERFSRKAVFGFCWAPLFFITALLWFTVAYLAVQSDAAHPAELSRAWWQIVLSVTLLPLGVLAPFGTTILGWLAVGDIRRLAGRLTGLGLAVFDGLFFPLLALDAFVVWVWIEGLRWLQGEVTQDLSVAGPAPVLLALGAAATGALVDFLIVRRVWRAVRLDGGPPPARGDWWWSTKQGATVIVLICALVVLASGRQRPQPGTVKVLTKELAQEDRGTGGLVAHLPNGGAVELLAVGNPNIKPEQWWSPRGAPLAHADYTIDAPADATFTGEGFKDILFRVEDWPERSQRPQIEFGLSPRAMRSDLKVVEGGRPMPDAWLWRVAFNQKARQFSLWIGVGLQDWRTIMSFAPADNQTRYAREPGDPPWDARLHQIVDNAGSAQITMLFKVVDPNWNNRLVAVDTNGVVHEHPSVGTGTGGAIFVTPNPEETTWTYTFRNLPLGSVKEFRVQVVQIHWTEFRDVALDPER